MILGGVATVLAAAWKFLGIAPFANDSPLDALYALVRRIRKADTEAQLETIEDEIDDILKAQRAKAAANDETAVDAATLNVAHRFGKFNSRSPAGSCEWTHSRPQRVAFAARKLFS